MHKLQPHASIRFSGFSRLWGIRTEPEEGLSQRKALLPEVPPDIRVLRPSIFHGECREWTREIPVDVARGSLSFYVVVGHVQKFLGKNEQGGAEHCEQSAPNESKNKPNFRFIK